MKYIFVALTLLLITKVNAQTSLEAGEKSPDFELQSIDGKLVSIESTQSKVILLNFWASWCGPCIESLQTTLLPLYNQYDRSDLEIIGISNDMKEDKWRSFISKHGIAWPNVWDENKALIRKYEVQGIPTYIIIDNKGTVIASNVYSRNLKSEVKKALRKSVNE